MKTTYSLGWTRCPCYCGGEGLVTFMQCPNCSGLFGACDEVDSFIADIRILKVNGEVHNLDCTNCPSCTEVSVSEFTFAEFDAIRQAGFDTTEIFRMPDPFPECPAPMIGVVRTYADHRRAQQDSDDKPDPASS